MPNEELMKGMGQAGKVKARVLQDKSPRVQETVRAAAPSAVIRARIWVRVRWSRSRLHGRVKLVGRDSWRGAVRVTERT